MNSMHQTHRGSRRKPTLLALAFVLAQIGCGGQPVVEQSPSNEGVVVSAESSESCLSTCSSAAASIIVQANLGALLESAEVTGCLAAVVNAQISSPVNVLGGVQSLARSYADAVWACVSSTELPVFGASDPGVIQCAYCILQVSCLPATCASACTSTYGQYAQGSCGADGVSGICTCNNLCPNNCNGDCQADHGYATWSGTCGGVGNYQCTCQNNCAAECDSSCSNVYGPAFGGSCDSGGACSCVCDAAACNDYCAQRNGTGSVGTCVDSGGVKGCSCSLPPTCVVSCDTNCGQPANVAPGCPPANCPNTDTCTEATCGQTVCGQQCPPCGCDGTVNACGECNGPTGGCDGCGNVWYDDCGVMCGDDSSCGCNGTVNACGECNGPAGGCDGCGNVWYDACGEPCGDGSECSGGGGGGGGVEMCPDYGAGMCGDTRIEETISAGGSVATSPSLATGGALQPLSEERHRRSPEERAARAADAVRLLKAWRAEATHKLKMTPAERAQLGKILEHQITALQRGGKAGGGRRQAQLQASAGIAKLLGAQRFARYEAVRTEWMTRNQAPRGSAH